MKFVGIVFAALIVHFCKREPCQTHIKLNCILNLYFNFWLHTPFNFVPSCFRFSYLRLHLLIYCCRDGLFGFQTEELHSRFSGLDFQCAISCSLRAISHSPRVLDRSRLASLRLRHELLRFRIYNEEKIYCISLRYFGCLFKRGLKTKSMGISKVGAIVLY